jgi:aspartate/glutamate racemase
VKRIGLLGGMSWESTAEYYRFVNEAARDRLGGLHSADCLLRSVDFAPIERLQREGRWDEAAVLLAADDRAIVHSVIYDELCVGVIRDESREQYRRIMRDLAGRGAQAILLGCTEIELLVGPEDSPVPVYDTTRLHAERAVELALR